MSDFDTIRLALNRELSRLLRGGYGCKHVRRALPALSRLEAQATLDQEHLTRVVAERAALEAERDERGRYGKGRSFDEMCDIAAARKKRAEAAEERSRQLAEAVKSAINCLQGNIPRQEVADDLMAALTSPSRDSAEREETDG